MAITAPSVPASGTALLNPTGDYVSVNTAGGTGTGVYVSYQSPPTIAQPAVPASTGTVTNNTGGYVAVAVAGGTVSVIAVNGVTIYAATGNTVIVPPGGNVGLTYTVAPTWTWTAVVDGASQAAGALAQNMQLPPGCSITLIYSVAPTWTWTNPDEIDYAPGFYGSNAQAEAAGWNPYTALPYAQHQVAGQSGLGTGVSN